jgi:hypothetical protein
MMELGRFDDVGWLPPALRELRGHRQQIEKSAALTVGALTPELTMIAVLTRARGGPEQAIKTKT